MPITNLHDTDKYNVRQAINIFDFMFKAGILNTTDITAADTVEGIRLLFVNAKLPDQNVPEQRSAVASLDLMEKYGLVDADILGLTTYATFLALFTSADPTGDVAGLYHGDVNRNVNSNVSRKVIN